MATSKQNKSAFDNSDLNKLLDAATSNLLGSDNAVVPLLDDEDDERPVNEKEFDYCTRWLRCKYSRCVRITRSPAYDEHGHTYIHLHADPALQFSNDLGERLGKRFSCATFKNVSIPPGTVDKFCEPVTVGTLLNWVLPHPLWGKQIKESAKPDQFFADCMRDGSLLHAFHLECAQQKAKDKVEKAYERKLQNAYSVPDLLDKNWTEEVIEKLLGKPDATDDYHGWEFSYSGGTYFEERVHSIEASQPFQAWLQAHLQVEAPRRVVAPGHGPDHPLYPHRGERKSYVADLDESGQPEGQALVNVSVNGQFVADRAWAVRASFEVSEYRSVEFSAVADYYWKNNQLELGLGLIRYLPY